MDKIQIIIQDLKNQELELKNRGLDDKHAQMRHDPLVGELCPRCQEGHLDYDGLLNLVCQQCGYTLTGCST